MTETAVNHLKKYAVFSKVDITILSDKLFAFGLTGPHIQNIVPPLCALPSGDTNFHIGKNHIAIKTHDLRWIIIGTDQIAQTLWEELSRTLKRIGKLVWDWLDIQGGFTFLLPETSGLFTPQMINWQKLGGVSFKKGCYLGQEIVARTEHLGKLKRHLYRATADTTTAIFPGTTLLNEQDQAIGTVTLTSPTPRGQTSLSAVIEDRAVESNIEIKDIASLDNISLL